MTCFLCRVWFWIGHCWSRGIVNHWPDSWERSGMALVSVYSWAMQKSLRYDGKGKCGEWTFDKPDKRSSGQVSE